MVLISVVCLQRMDGFIRSFPRTRVRWRGGTERGTHQGCVKSEETHKNVEFRRPTVSSQADSTAFSWSKTMSRKECELDFIKDMLFLAPNRPHNACLVLVCVTSTGRLACRYVYL